MRGDPEMRDFPPPGPPLRSAFARTPADCRSRSQPAPVFREAPRLAAPPPTKAPQADPADRPSSPAATEGRWFRSGGGGLRGLRIDPPESPESPAPGRPPRPARAGAPAEE